MMLKVLCKCGKMTIRADENAITDKENFIKQSEKLGYKVIREVQKDTDEWAHGCKNVSDCVFLQTYRQEAGFKKIVDFDEYDGCCGD